MLKDKKIKKREFHPVKTLSDLGICRDKLVVEEAEEPRARCSITRERVTKRVIETVRKYNEKADSVVYYVSTSPVDLYINFTDRFPKFYPSKLEMTETAPLVEVVKEYDHILLLLKCEALVGELLHSMLIILEIVKREVKEIQVVDTAPIDYIKPHKLTHVIKMNFSPFGIEIGEPVVRYPINEVADELYIEYDDPILSIQTSEKQLAKGGYCNAWVLYFIYNMAKNKTIDNIYKRLIVLGTNEAITAKIMRWWKKNQNS